MSRWYFVPDSFELTDDLKQFARDKGLTEANIEEQEEIWRDHQYRVSKIDPERCWRNWVRNAIKFGDVVPVQETKYNQPEELSEDEVEADRVKAWKELNRLKGI